MQCGLTESEFRRYRPVVIPAPMLVLPIVPIIGATFDEFPPITMRTAIEADALRNMDRAEIQKLRPWFPGGAVESAADHTVRTA
ncbi:hypothetical protein [Burkholderia pyrrocinia]|uniref:hypothetical protein n=1 Tax=Burkholderia pyrrocinia TaxID=60550 RepID=UPI001BCCE53B|nr:hypothetical protein [Burkholderia pyrrocinia]QVN21363.1 hypothetical protein JYG32_18285 [Burkholderia pyrrocinia]